MKTGIKVITLIFFISGISFFVAYQSGYFSESEAKNSPTQVEVEAESQKELDSIFNAIPAEERDFSMPEVEKKEEPIEEPNESLKELTEEDKFRMYSSKTIITLETFTEPKRIFSDVWFGIDPAMRKLLAPFLRPNQSKPQDDLDFLQE